MVNQFYYPEWRAVNVNDGRLLDVKAGLPEGLLEVQVPPGHQQVRLEIPLAFAERLGRWISVLCVLVCVVLAGRPKRLEGVPLAG